jgi:hypothetical protein
VVFWVVAVVALLVPVAAAVGSDELDVLSEVGGD